MTTPTPREALAELVATFDADPIRSEAHTKPGYRWFDAWQAARAALAAVQPPLAEEGKDAQDAARWRALVAKFGNEYDLATPGKLHDLVIRLNPDGCEVHRADGSLDFKATIEATVDDEIRIQSAAIAAMKEPT